MRIAATTGQEFWNKRGFRRETAETPAAGVLKTNDVDHQM